MTPPVVFQDIALRYLANLQHEGDPMPDHSPELCAAGAELRATGGVTHAHQDADGSWYDVPCDCPDSPGPGDMIDGRVVLDADDDRFDDELEEATR